MEPTVCGGTDINPVITNTAELFEKIIILWKHRPRETDLEWGTGKVSLRNYNTQTQTRTMCGRQSQLERKGWPEEISEKITQVIFTETGYNTHYCLELQVLQEQRAQCFVFYRWRPRYRWQSAGKCVFEVYSVLLLIQYVSKEGLWVSFNHGSDLETLNWARTWIRAVCLVWGPLGPWRRGFSSSQDGGQEVRTWSGL